MTDDALDKMSIYELFALEVEGQVPPLTDALLALEAQTLPLDQLKTCMRCVHSLKGAARMVNLGAGVAVCHAMEECLVAAQDGKLRIARTHIDALLQGVDCLQQIAKTPEAEMDRWTPEDAQQAQAIATAMDDLIHRSESVTPASMAATESSQRNTPPETQPNNAAVDDRMLRVTAENLNRILGISSEILVGSRWLKPFSDSLVRLKQQQRVARKHLETLDALVSELPSGDSIAEALRSAMDSMDACSHTLTQSVAEFDQFSQRKTNLARRLYDQALASRMRPFRDGIAAFPRMVRDLGNALGKPVRLQISGQSTLVDRDILALLEAPLNHLLRNAIDHGLEPPDIRMQAGKPPESTLKLEAIHQAGLLIVSVSDDGRGVPLEQLRERIVAKRLTSAEMAHKLSNEELLEFLFLPGFSMRDVVTEYSGRGVGLDVVQHMAKQLHGTVRIVSQPGLGTSFRLCLPLTTSVIRVLLVEVAGEPYAFPLANIGSALAVATQDIAQVEGHHHFNRNGVQVGLVTAHQLFDRPAAQLGETLAVVVLGDAPQPYGVIVDRFLGECEVVVRPLDPRLGKIKDIAAAALMENGAPLLIVDVEDMTRSVRKLVAEGLLLQAADPLSVQQGPKRKRVLLVDDSLTVRELERKLLTARGYEVDVAVDGVDGWNAARLGNFDLIISDIDMPRMDGIEMVTRLRQHPKLRSTPVVIVSYKDREADRQRGLAAGADYYLTKGSFHDDGLIQAVIDLIGEASA